MKSTLNGKLPNTFPKLRVLTDKCPSTGTVVLFDTPVCGTVVYAKGIYSIGHYSTNWCESGFTDYTGEVVLSND